MIRKKSKKDPGSKEAVDLVMNLMAIPGKSGEEKQVVDFMVKDLRRCGMPQSWIVTDRAHKKTPIGGNTGNLVVKLPGTNRQPRRMFTAHLDTVPECVGSKPVRRRDVVRSADPSTGLGADDRAGCAVLLHTVQEIYRRKAERPPLTFCWFVQEEVGIQGSKNANRRLWGAPKMAFNFDGGSPAKLTIGATGCYRIDIEITGLASHAAAAPKKGISAVAIAAMAIADLQKNGWHGAIKKGKKLGTSNVGVIRGGTATNVVAEHLFIKAEARSHDAIFRRRILKEIKTAFNEARSQIRNDSGKRGKVRFDATFSYDSYLLNKKEAVVSFALSAIKGLGLKPSLAVTGGALDANWLNQYKIPTVSLGAGAAYPHTVKEVLNIHRFNEACKIAWKLATT
jgi:tripeptide aminopeptidase